jgi:low affinity Fe/Cu permease
MNLKHVPIPQGRDMLQDKDWPKVPSRREARLVPATINADATREEFDMDLPRMFSTVADEAAFFLGKPVVFFIACLSTVAWIVSGPLFGWSDTWQLVANTVTNLVTFLMVFVLQNSQNRDGAALQAKLDEVLRAVAPQNQLVGIEDLTHEEIEDIKARRAKAKA